MTSDHGWKFIHLFPLKWFSFIELKLLFSISMLGFFEYEWKKCSPVQLLCYIHYSPRGRWRLLIKIINIDWADQPATELKMCCHSRAACFDFSCRQDLNTQTCSTFSSRGQQISLQEVCFQHYTCFFLLTPLCLLMFQPCIALQNDMSPRLPPIIFYWVQTLFITANYRPAMYWFPICQHLPCLICFKTHCTWL